MLRNVVLVAIMSGWSAAAIAQRPTPLTEEGGATRQPPAGRASARNPAANRMMLERQVRQRLARRAKEVAGLSDEQMTRLGAMDRELTPQRIQLLREEGQTRQALRRAMADSTNVDQTRIADYTAKLVDIQRRRADLLDAEQKQLGTFMTPLQRAKYLALEEQVRKMVTQRLEQPGRAPPSPR